MNETTTLTGEEDPIPSIDTYLHLDEEKAALLAANKCLQKERADAIIRANRAEREVDLLRTLIAQEHRTHEIGALVLRLVNELIAEFR